MVTILSPSTPTKTGILLTLMFLNFFQFYEKILVNVYIFPLFYFHTMVQENSKNHKMTNSLRFFVIVD